MADDLIPVMIRELPGGTDASNAGVEIDQGDNGGRVSRKMPARIAEVIARSYLLSRSTVNPPGGAAEGDRYYVPAGATGAWAAQVGKIAEWLLVPNAAGASTGAWYFAPALGLNFIEDEGVPIAFSAGAPVSFGVTALRSVAIDTAVLASDGIVRVNAADGVKNVAVNRALGSAAATLVFVIERDMADASNNWIVIKDDAGNIRGAITSKVVDGQVPFLSVYADGTNVICRGVP